MAILKKGLRGEPVRRLQAKLGVDADGIFGPGTEKALRAYQKENGLSVDGMAGPDTFSEMGLHELILLKRGSRGKTVKRLQEALDAGADGIFGRGTEKKVKAFQKEEELFVDGVAGPNTLARLDLFTEINEQTVELSRVPDDYEDPMVPEGADWVTELPEGVSMEPEVEDVVASAEEPATEEPAAEEPKGEEEGGVWGTVKGWFS